MERFIQLILLCSFISSLLAFSCSTVTDNTLCSQMNGCTAATSGCNGTFAPTCTTTVCYYIDPVGGSDTNAGAALTPFLTLTAAFKKVAAVTTTATLTVLNYNSDTEAVIYNYTNFTTAATIYVFRQFSNYTYTINMQSLDVSTIPTNNSMAIYIAAGQLQIVGAMFNANSVKTGVTTLFELGNGKLTLRDTLIQDYQGSAVFVRCGSAYTSAQFNYTGGRYANTTFTFRLLAGTSSAAHVFRNVRFISNLVSDYLIYATTGIEITNVYVRWGSSLFINSTATTITVTNLTIKDYTGNFLDIANINRIIMNTSLFQNIASTSSIPFIRITNVGSLYGAAHSFKAVVFQNMSVKHSVLLVEKGNQKINFENVTYDTIYKMSDAVNTTVLDLEYDASWPGGVCFLGRSSIAYNLTTSTFQNIYSHCGALASSTLLIVSSVFNNTALNYTPVAVSEDHIDETYGVTWLYFSGGTTDLSPGSSIAIKTSKFLSNKISPLYGGALRFTSAFALTIAITDTQFFNCEAFYGGAIYVDNSLLTLQISNGAFYQNQAKNGGAILKKSDGISVMSAPVSTLILNTTTFTENTATGKGGAIYLDYEFLKMNTTSFTSNTATNGGGIYYIKQSLLNVTDKFLRNSTFTSNYASNSGHAMKLLFKYSLLAEDTTSPVVYVNNSEADTGKNVSDGRPSYYMFSFYDVLTTQKVTNVSEYNNWILDSTLTRLTNQVNSSAIPAGFRLNHKSGNPLTQLIMAQVYDDYNNAVTYINKETVSMEITDTQNNISDFSAFIAGNIATFTFNQGLFFMKTSVKMVGQPTTTATLTYTGSSDTSIILNDANALMDMSWTVYFIDCELGDIFSSLTKQCDTCPEGSYSLEDPYSNSVCIDCSTFATCPGGSRIAPLPGYWRFSAMSDNILECPESSACIGGLVNDEYYPQGLCIAPYSGHMCNTCDSDFAKFGDSATCVDCSTDTLYYIKFTGYFLIQIIALLYGVKCNVDKMSNVKKAHLEDNQALKEKLHNEDFQSNLMKIGVNFLQVSAIVIDYKFDWPSFITNFVNVTNKFFPSQKEGFSIDCLITLASGSNEYTYFIKLVITLIEPFALWVALILIYALYLKVKGEKVKGNPNFKKDMLVLFIITAFLLQPTVMQATLQMFKCENLNVSSDPQYYMSDNSATECWTPFHLLWSLAIALPNFLLWTFVLPGVLLRMLMKKAKELKNPEVYARFSFVYEGLKTDKYYWEFVVMLRKMLIVLIFVFFNFISVQSQAFATFLVVLAFGCLHYVFWPYTDERLNRAEMVALVSLGVMVYCGMFFLSNGGSAWLYVVLIVFSLIFNLFFFVYLGLLFLKSYKKTAVIMKKKLTEVIERRRTQRSGSKSNNSSMSSEKKNTIVDIQDLSLVLGKVQIENNMDSPTTQLPQMSEGMRFVHHERRADDDDSGIPSELNVNRWTSGKTVFNDEKADVDNYSVLRSSIRGKSEVRTEARTNAKRNSGGTVMTPELFQDVIHLYNMRRSSLVNSNDQKYLGKSFSIFDKADEPLQKENQNEQEEHYDIDDEEKQRRDDEEKQLQEQNPEKYDEKTPKDHTKKHSKNDVDEENKRGSNNMDDDNQE